MKTKHNKKRNTGFIFEALIRELTKSVLAKNIKKASRVRSIIREYFSYGKALKKELDCYKALCEADNLDGYTAEKLVYEVKREHGSINQKKLFIEQSKMIKQINREIGSDLFSTFIPNYRALATVAQIFSDQTPVKKKVLMEKHVLENLTQRVDERVEKNLKPIDDLVVKTFTNKYNDQYSELLPEQKGLLNRHILSIRDGGTDFKVFLNSELRRLHTEVKNSLVLEDVRSDEQMINNTNSVLKIIESFDAAEFSSENLKTVLKIQKLANEYKKDAN
jgi:hypothetical protein|tara:strand:- start:1232 stop:2062 length:831 start_codon:yes stop_codon:yes gene_type:complete